MNYAGDIALEATIDVKFTTVSTVGVPTTLAGTPSVAAYPGNSTTEITAGITLTVDFDARTGLHNVRVVATAANGYAAGTNYTLVITAGTVGGSSVVGYVVGSFSIEHRRGESAYDRVLLALPNAAADAAGGIPISDAGALDLDVKLANTHEITAARMGALTDWIDGGRLDLILDARASQASVDVIDGIVDAILIDTAEIGAAGVGLTEAGGTGDHLTAVPWNAAWDPEVQSEVNDALVALRLDEIFIAASDTGTYHAQSFGKAAIDAINTVITGGFDPAVDEVVTGFTWNQWARIVGATTAGAIDNAGQATESFDGIDGAVDVVTATVDGSGNRSNLIYNP